MWAGVSKVANAVVSGEAVGGGGSSLVQDTFTDTDSVLLVNHTPDVDTVGTGWILHVLTVGSTNGMLITSNKAQDSVGTATGSAYAYVIDAGQADCTITSDFFTGGTNGNLSGFSYRVPGAQDYFVAVMNTATDELRIYEETGGTATLRASSDTSVPFAISTTYALSLVLSGNSATLTVGAQSVSYSTAVRNTVTSHGLGSVSGTATDGANWDDYEVVS